MMIKGHRIPIRNLVLLFFALVFGSAVLCGVWPVLDWTSSPVREGFNLQKYFCQDTISQGRRLNCSEQRHIVYIKNPKCGSTTITSLLRKFGLSRCLTFAVPRRGIYFSELTDETIRRAPPGRRFDMLYHRLTYNHDVIASTFPNNTVVVTSIRDPFTRFVSAFKYFGYSRYIAQRTGKRNRDLWFYIREFLKHPKRYDKRDSDSWSSKVMNRVPDVFGIPMSKIDNVTFVKEYIHGMLTNDRWLVVLIERFDESLVLLRRKLCWKLSDILYIPLRMSSERTPISHKPYPRDILKRYKSVAHAEYLLYQTFVSVVWKQMTIGEDDVPQEVTWLKVVLKTVWRFCDRNNVTQSHAGSTWPSTDHVTIDESPWNKVFDFTRGDCELLLVEDIDFRRHLQHRDKLQRISWYREKHTVWWKLFRW